MQSPPRIPRYAGFIPRVAAQNVVGHTYAESQRIAGFPEYQGEARRGKDDERWHRLYSADIYGGVHPTAGKSGRLSCRTSSSGTTIISRLRYVPPSKRVWENQIVSINANHGGTQAIPADTLTPASVVDETYHWAGQQLPLAGPGFEARLRAIERAVAEKANTSSMASVSVKTSGRAGLLVDERPSSSSPTKTKTVADSDGMQERHLIESWVHRDVTTSRRGRRSSTSQK